MGRLGSPHGLKGFIGLYADEDDVELFNAGNTVLIGDEAMVVRALRRGDKGFQIAFEGVPDRSAAEELRGATVGVFERRALGDDEYWPEDLVGLEARDPKGTILGTVLGVEHGPIQDRLIVDVDGIERQVPLVAELVPSIDIEDGHVTVVDMPGLLSGFE